MCVSSFFVWSEDYVVMLNMFEVCVVCVLLIGVYFLFRGMLCNLIV